MSKNDFITKYKRCIYEYTNAAGAFDITEDNEENVGPIGNDPMTNNDPMGGGPDMGSDPGMGGGPDMGGDPGMGGGPDMGGENNGAEGFNPEGGEENQGIEGMGGESTEDSVEDEEVIDVDDLTKSQEKAEEKIDKMNDKFEKLMQSVETLIKLNKEREERDTEMINQVKSELEKRIPTPEQKLSMRSTKSAPYGMTPNEYMNNYAPDNYSAEDDKNGVNDTQYQITKGDIDRFTDYNSIAKDLDIEHQGLRDIFGF